MTPYVLLGLLWAIWLLGLFTEDPLRSLAVSLANFAGAYALARIARQAPVVLRRALMGLGLGLLLLGVGDLFFTYQVTTGQNTRALREPFYLLGVAFFLLMGTLLPFRMGQQGLYPVGFFPRLALAAILGGTLLAAASTLIRPLGLVELIYAAAAFYLTLLFAQQTPLLAGGRIGRSLQGVVWALVLGSLARVVDVLGGVPPAYWSIVVYDILWLLAMSVLLLGFSRTQAPRSP